MTTFTSSISSVIINFILAFQFQLIQKELIYPHSLMNCDRLPQICLGRKVKWHCFDERKGRVGAHDGKGITLQLRVV